MTPSQSVTERPEPQQHATTPSPSAGTLVSIGGRQALVALRFLVAMIVILGILYPLAVLGIGQLVAHDAANGSLVTDSSGTVVGSELIGQQFDGPQGNPAQWFAGRPSAAGDGYDAMSSGGSNLAADSPDLLADVEDRRAQIAADNGVDPSTVPPDALTASASVPPATRTRATTSSASTLGGRGRSDDMTPPWRERVGVEPTAPRQAPRHWF